MNGLDVSELFAEKITALAGRNYLKARDLFDLWYLNKILETQVDISLVEKKIKDYCVERSGSEVEKKLRNFKPEIIDDEMQRFLPQNYRLRLQKNLYETIIQTANEVMESVITILN